MLSLCPSILLHFFDSDLFPPFYQETSVDAIEEKIGCGQVEELIDQVGWVGWDGRENDRVEHKHNNCKAVGKVYCSVR